jgi:hypothetical protein
MRIASSHDRRADLINLITAPLKKGVFFKARLSTPSMGLRGGEDAQVPLYCNDTG